MKWYTIIICMLSSVLSMATNNYKDFNFIICVDENIIESIVRPSIVIQKGDEVIKNVEVSYIPGKLSMNTDDYVLLSTEGDASLFLSFYYYEYSSTGKQKMYNYKIEIGKNLFTLSYVIFYIYNLDKKKYKKKLKPLSKDQNYAFDLSTSNGQMIRVRN